MIKKILIGLVVGVVGLGLLIKSGILSGGLRAMESLVRPVLHKEIINRYCGVYKEDPYFIMSMIKVESNFLRGAKSSRGALGLMQIMPATAKEISRELKLKDFKEASLADPETNIRFGIHYVAKLRRELGDHDLTVLAAYNAGKKNVLEWLKATGRKELDHNDIEFIETHNFVNDVLRTYTWLKRWQKLRGKVVTKMDKPT
ncbi:MAG: hypothetical protein A2901_06615 [Elusimicrobia bacterium RIFCSPLOWO2_01_FULL_54_10]|nr:MAG: hypothetical protein A2901_06615 [Elusimicrobia bacterium RIFCSPLOWO2_01_FULL_54_10]